MSSIVNKVKDALHHDKSSQPEGTHGPHNARTANATDPRVDSDRDHRARHDLSGAEGNYSTGDNYSTTDSRGFGTDGPASKTDGPHKSNLTNKADPRVDSDRDYSKNMGANPSRTDGTGKHNVGEGTYGSGITSGTTTGTTGTTGTRGTTGGLSSGASEGTYGTHNSRAANVADPRVDSDLDGSRNMGLRSGTTAHGTTGGMTGSRAPGVAEGSFGTHNSRMANAADPRIDSDLDGSRNVGARSGTATHGGTTGMTGTHGTTDIHSSSTRSGLPEGSVGPHSSRMANTADPRVDSDLDSSRRTAGTGMGSTGTYGSNTAGSGMGSTGAYGTTSSSTGMGTGMGMSGTQTTGPAPNTAGPHKSDMLNKADPRVDSNLDGSKTVGGDKTYAQSNDDAMAYKDPTDAAQVPPSVLQKHVGGPAVHHDDPDHGYEKRHSVSHQENHRGL